MEECACSLQGASLHPLPPGVRSSALVCASNPSINFSDVHLYIENIDMSRNFSVDKWCSFNVFFYCIYFSKLFISTVSFLLSQGSLLGLFCYPLVHFKTHQLPVWTYASTIFLSNFLQPHYTVRFSLIDSKINAAD